MQVHLASSGKRSERNTLFNLSCIERVSFVAKQGDARAHALWPSGHVSALLQGVDCTSDHCHCHCYGTIRRWSWCHRVRRRPSGTQEQSHQWTRRRCGRTSKRCGCSNPGALSETVDDLKKHRQGGRDHSAARPSRRVQEATARRSRRKRLRSAREQLSTRLGSNARAACAATKWGFVRHMTQTNTTLVSPLIVESLTTSANEMVTTNAGGSCLP